MRLSGHHAAADRAQGHEARVAARGDQNRWIFMGFDEDLNKAMVSAVRETVDFLASQKMVPLDRYGLTP